MGSMNVYDYLWQIKNSEYKVKNAEREIERLKTLAQSAGAMDYSVDIVQNGKATQEPSFVHTLEQMDRQLKKLQKIVSDYNELRALIYDQINALEPKFARVLYLKYFENKSWKRIAFLMNYSYGNVRHLHRAAIKAFRDTYGDEYESQT